jgi:urease gamma subunit
VVYDGRERLHGDGLIRLTPRERDRLLIFAAAQMARGVRDQGLRLNHPEAVALICDEVLQAARRGEAYNDVKAAGLSAVTVDDVLAGVPELVSQLEIEATFEDGTKLVSLDRPITRRA